MGDISSVELVDRWVFEDLSANTFTDHDRREILNDIEELRDQLTLWDRQLTKAVDILEGTGSETIYYRRQGDFRTFFIRQGDTLYGIGVARRPSAYNRGIGTLLNRAKKWRSK